MAFHAEVNRVTISGTSFGGEEQWTTGFYMGYAGGDADDPTQELADEIALRWTTFFTAANTKVNNNWKTTEIKVAKHSASGATDPSNVVYHTYPTPITGANVTPTFPAQIALVATLVSPVPRGLASKGRMYLPGITATVDGNGRMPDTDRLNICTGLRTFLRALVDFAGTDNVPLVVSKGREAPFIGAPIAREVFSVRVGNVYDTQRRRRNALTEVYSNVNI